MATDRSIVLSAGPAPVVSRIWMFMDADINARGHTPQESARTVLAMLEDDPQMLADLLEAEGTNWILSLWERQKAQEPRRPTRRPEKRRAQPIQRFLPGHIDTAESILECPYEVDGKWVTVGDMQRSACRKVADRYYNQSDADRKRAQFFDRIERALKEFNDNTTVRQVLNEEVLESWLADAAG